MSWLLIPVFFKNGDLRVWTEESLTHTHGGEAI